MRKKKEQDWDYAENDNLHDFNRHSHLTDEELEKFVKDGFAQLDKEIAEGKRDLD